MAQPRFLYHPILANRQSIRIFIIFFFLSIVIGVFFWVYVDQALQQADADILTLTNNGILSVLLSHHFRYALIFAAAFLGGAFTATVVVGPVKRIETWLKDWEFGHRMAPLRVRQGDKFTMLVKLINELHQRITTKS